MNGEKKKKRLVERVSSCYIPYDNRGEPITERQKRIKRLQSKIIHLDNLAEEYLQKYLQKRREILKQLRELP